MKTLDDLAVIPYRFIRSQMNWRSSGKPSVGPYCNACAPCSDSTRQAASWVLSIGSSSGAGIPPANEMRSGCWVNFSSSRMIERPMRWLRWA